MKNLAYVLLSIALTVLCWGAYGPLLRVGTLKMQGSHWLPFLFVGVAYFLIAVVASSALLIWRGEPGNWNLGGTLWSFVAGVVTAVGALGVILALANKGSPIFVMPLVFGGAPVINTLLSMWMSKTHREAGPFFYAGLILVVAGAVAVLVFSPPPAPQPHAGDQPPPEFKFTDLLAVLSFVALAAICWGCYGPLLHKGQTWMQGSRLRPFICVGAAYVVVAIVGPLILWAAMGDKGQVSAPGVLWSLAGGAAGAIGALGIIFAFTFGGKPVYVMPLVFGGAPVVNTLISLAASGASPSLPFYAGLMVVIAGAVTVLLFAPRGQPHKPAETQPAVASPEAVKT
jgi:hypothetical protein